MRYESSAYTHLIQSLLSITIVHLQNLAPKQGAIKEPLAKANGEKKPNCVEAIELQMD
jgi:hypothetical protein